MIARLSKHSPLGRVLSAGLRNVKSSREAMKEAIEESAAAGPAPDVPAGPGLLQVTTASIALLPECLTPYALRRMSYTVENERTRKKVHGMIRLFTASILYCEESADLIAVCAGAPWV